MSETVLLEPPKPVAVPALGVSLADLILVRLLPEKKSLAPKKLRNDLAVFFRRPPGAEQLASATVELRANGFLLPKGQNATDAGRARALQFLGIEKPPPKANWRALKAKYLVPKALGLPDSKGTADLVGDGNKLAAFLLKRELALPVGTGNTLNKVFEAIACQQLGYRDHTTLKELIPLLLARAIGNDTPVSGQDALTVVPRVLLNAKQKGTAGLRSVVLAGWADGPEPEPVVEPFDLEMFANTVKSVARTCPTGRFGDNKVFINHVWNQLRDERPFAGLGLAGFKDKLVEANRENRLTLSRADLVQLMDPNDVRESEITYLTATFHFILVEKD